MSTQSALLQQSSTHLDNWEEVFLFLKGYAISKDMKNTIIALNILPISFVKIGIIK